MELENVRSQLQFLKLHTAAKELDRIIGSQRKAISLEWISQLLENEIGASKELKIQTRIKKAHFPELKKIEAIRNDSLDQLFKKILGSKLWIIDDWGVVTYPRDIAEEVFDLLDRRKQNSAMILTNNHDVEEWPQVFPDPIIANAAICELPRYLG